MNELKMYTQEEVSQLLNAHIMTVSMLREVGVLPAIKTGRNYMVPYQVIQRFYDEYEGLDVSNRVSALKSKEIVEERRQINYRKELNYYGSSKERV